MNLTVANLIKAHRFLSKKILALRKKEKDTEMYELLFKLLLDLFNEGEITHDGELYDVLECLLDDEIVIELYANVQAEYEETQSDEDKLEQKTTEMWILAKEVASLSKRVKRKK